MLFLLAVYLTTYGVLSSTEAMVGSAFSMVRRDGDSVPLCAIDQPSAVKSTISAIWCGIECITTSSSTCHSFSYFETINKCDIFFSEPTNYAAEDGCVTFDIGGPPGEVQDFPANVPTSTAQQVNAPSSTANELVSSAADYTTSSTIASSIISTAGPAVAASAAPTSIIPDSISTPPAPAAPSTIDTHVVSSAAAATTTTATEISTAGSSGQLVQTTTTTPAEPLIFAPPPPPPAAGVVCPNIVPSGRVLMQQNTGNGLDQSWSVYKYGFNDQTGGYWIGNENLHRMTNNGTTCRLCIDMQATGGAVYFSLYSSFIVGNEGDGYNYTTSGFSGNVADSFTVSNRECKFSAKDQNNQPSCPNYASDLKGGWWYPCSANQVVLNGVGTNGFFWADPQQGAHYLAKSIMWIACP